MAIFQGGVIMSKKLSAVILGVKLTTGDHPGDIKQVSWIVYTHWKILFPGSMAWQKISPGWPRCSGPQKW